MLVISALRGLRQEEFELNTSLGYIASSSQKKQKQEKEKMQLKIKTPHLY
jgi:hypothetical protein